MQLGIVAEPSIEIRQVTHRLPEFLITKRLGFLQTFTEMFTNLHRRKCTLQVVCRLTVQIVKHLIGQSLRVCLTMSQDSQALAGHPVFMTVHPRQQPPVGQALPVVGSQRLSSKCLYDFLQRG